MISQQDPILHIMPKDQLDYVFEQDCDIDTEFLGFTEIYRNLSAIVPLHWTVIDLGCAYAPQSHLFSKHKSYVGVDIGEGRRFHAENTTHYKMSIEQFIATHGMEFDQSTTFAICSYVPPWYGDNRSMVRNFFENLFVYYPAGSRVNVPFKSNPTRNGESKL